MRLWDAIERWVAEHRAGLSNSTRHDIADIATATVRCGYDRMECADVRESHRREIIADADAHTSLNPEAIGQFLSIVVEWGATPAADGTFVAELEALPTDADAWVDSTVGAEEAFDESDRPEDGSTTTVQLDEDLLDTYSDQFDWDDDDEWLDDPEVDDIFLDEPDSSDESADVDPSPASAEEAVEFDELFEDEDDDLEDARVEDFAVEADEELENLGVDEDDVAQDDDLEAVGVDEDDVAQGDDLEAGGVAQAEFDEDDGLEAVGVDEDDFDTDDDLEAVGVDEDDFDTDDDLAAVGVDEDDFDADEAAEIDADLATVDERDLDDDELDHIDADLDALLEPIEDDGEPEPEDFLPPPGPEPEPVPIASANPEHSAASSFLRTLDRSSPSQQVFGDLTRSLEPAAEATDESGIFSEAAQFDSRRSIDWITVAYFAVAVICFGLVIYFYFSS